MKGHIPSRGRHSPPFLLIGLIIVIVIVGINYWHTSSQLQEQGEQYASLQHRHRELIAQKIQLESTNEVLESRLKKSEEIYENIRQAQDKKDEEMSVLSEQLKSARKDTERKKIEDEHNDDLAQKMLNAVQENTTQLMLLHKDDEEMIKTLQEKNTKLSAQLSLMPSPPTVGDASTRQCDAICLTLVEAAQEKLFKKVESKIGPDAVEILRTSDYGATRKPGREVTGLPLEGKLPSDILLVGRDGKVITESPIISKPSSDLTENSVVSSDKVSDIDSQKSDYPTVTSSDDVQGKLEPLLPGTTTSSNPINESADAPSQIGQDGVKIPEKNQGKPEMEDDDIVGGEEEGRGAVAGETGKGAHGQTEPADIRQEPVLMPDVRSAPAPSAQADDGIDEMNNNMAAIEGVDKGNGENIPF